jgi:hypothetical protein
MRTGKQIEVEAQRFHVRRQIEDAERGRRAELMRPPSPNDQRLFTPTKCRVLRMFCVAGKPVELGSTVTLAQHDAASLAASGKVTIL